MRLFSALAAVSLMMSMPALAETSTIDPGDYEKRSIELYSDIQFATQEPTFTRTELYLDFMRPASDEPTPVVVFVMGSGWRAVERERLLPQLVEFAEAGYAVATIDYRGSGESTFPTPQTDVQAAVRFLKANAEAYNINPDKIALYGNSAGGHLVLTAGLSGDEFTAEDTRWADESSSVAAIIALYPAAYFDSGSGRFNVHLNVVPDDEANAEIVSRATPETYLSADNPPVLLIHGTADQVVPIASSERLYLAASAAGADFDFITVEGLEHSFEDTHSISGLVDAMIDFLDENVKNVE